MKLSEITLQEIFILILFVGLLCLGADHLILRKEIAFGKRMDEFKTWQVQATNAINGLVGQRPPVPQPKPKVGP
jgi:hypothetical protein